MRFLFAQQSFKHFPINSIFPKQDKQQKSKKKIKKKLKIHFFPLMHISKKSKKKNTTTTTVRLKNASDLMLFRYIT